MNGVAQDGPLQGYPAECIHELIEDQVSRTPGAPALVSCDGNLNYGLMNQRANRLARYLRSCGAGPEVFVGICMDRSIESAVAALAVLKAGAAYVPLAPNQPEPRLRVMIRDAEILLAISTLRHRPLISVEGIEVICPDDVAPDITAESDENLSSGVGPDNAAFVRFTSGSTGNPKGVVNIHRSLTSRLIAKPLPDIQAEDICALKAFGFGSRLLLPLALGAKVAILGEDETEDVKRLAYSIGKYRVSSIYMVPSLLRQLLSLDSVVSAELVSLRAVTVGGEPLTPDVVVDFKKRLPHTQLITLYGSTEIGTTAAMRIVSETPDADWRSVGRAVANTKIHVLDSNMNPVEVGAAGEICVASPHLARGYLGQPTLTEARFLPDPFHRRPGGRLYRTGDRGRYSESGEIEFLGREDNQVKIRGFRVELEEIESVLRNCEPVHECVVAARCLNEITRLIAYVVPKAETDPASREMRDHCGRYLPDYMVPAVFVFLDRIPRTVHGKVDRASLPMPDPTRPQLDSPYVQPTNSLETNLGEIWKSLLGLEDVGIHDEFLELGGDSLLATRLMLQIEEEFGVEIPIGSILDRLTVATLTSHIVSNSTALERSMTDSTRTPDQTPESSAW